MTLVTPKEIQQNFKPNSEGARDPIFDLMTRLRAAYPRRALGWSDPDAALAELGKLIADGVDVEELPGCAERMGQDPAIKRRDFGPPKLEAWLAKRQFEGWWPEPEREASPAAAMGATLDPVEALPGDVVEAFGADFVRAWLGGARWRDEDRTLVTARPVQRDKIRRDLSGILHEHGWRVIAQADLPSDQPSQGA